MPSQRCRRPSAVCLPHGSPFAVWWRRRSPRSGVAKRRSATADRYSGVRDLRSVPELHGPIDARLFFERFVATRTPVIVRGGVQRETMAVLADDAALDAAAGDCQLQVEVPTLPPTPSLRLGQPSPRAAYSLFLTHRSSLTGVCSPHPHHALRSTHSRLQVEVRAGADSFGKGNRRRMRFGALLHKVGRPVLTRVAVANHRGLACASGRATAVPRPCRSACARHLPEAQCPGTAPAYVQRLARLLARHVQSLSRALAEP